MPNEQYQTVTPRAIPRSINDESMTFDDESSRNRYVQLQRANGWDVFLSYQGSSNQGKELYSISRSAL